MLHQHHADASLLSTTSFGSTMGGTTRMSMRATRHWIDSFLAEVWLWLCKGWGGGCARTAVVTS